MDDLKKLLKQAKDLYGQKRYHDVIELLEEDLLKQHNNEESNIYRATAYNILGNSYKQLKRFDEAIDLFKKSIAVNPEYKYSYNGLGNIYGFLEEYDKAIEYYNKCISIDARFSHAYNGLGNCFKKVKKIDEAIKCYEKCIELEPTQGAPYNGLGNIYTDLNDYAKATEFYKKCIEKNAHVSQPYNGLGIVELKKGNFDKAIQYFNDAIRIDATYQIPYFNKASSLFLKGEYLQAKKEFQRYLELSTDRDEYYTKIAVARIEEIKKLLANDAKVKKDINEIIAKIQELLLYNGKCVIHYTGLSVAKALILNKSKFRLSEGTFLNDTSEGKELFEFLQFNLKTINLKGTVALPFIQKPFIGSFVAENKYDDLTLWRMYGKENKEEAKGCALIIEKEELIRKLTEEITKDSSLGINKEFSFYRVAYRETSNGGTSKFIIPGDKKNESKLNRLMKDLKKAVNNFNENGNKKDSDTQYIVESLNNIAYLFKSAEYQYEHELRLVVKGTGFEKTVSSDVNPPRVYIELIAVPSLLRKLTIGPKVDRADEWAAAFHYSLDKEGYNPEILISHLPYK